MVRCVGGFKIVLLYLFDFSATCAEETKPFITSVVVGSDVFTRSVLA